jgi:hypothetical protein
MSEPKLTGTEIEDIHVGKLAAELLEDPLLARAFVEVHGYYLHKATTCERSERDRYLDSAEIVLDVQRVLRGYIDTGKLAERRLSIINKIGKAFGFERRVDRFRFGEKRSDRAPADPGKTS